MGIGIELRCEVTEYMDKFRDPKQIPKGYEDLHRTYIMAKDGKPEIGTYSEGKDFDKYYFWWIRIPGYTCANIVFNKSDDTVAEILLTRRGGAFANSKEETAYLNPDKLQKELNEKFVGKKLKWWDDDKEENK